MNRLRSRRTETDDFNNGRTWCTRTSTVLGYGRGGEILFIGMILRSILVPVPQEGNRVLL